MQSSLCCVGFADIVHELSRCFSFHNKHALHACRHQLLLTVIKFLRGYWVLQVRSALVKLKDSFTQQGARQASPQTWNKAQEQPLAYFKGGSQETCVTTPGSLQPQNKQGALKPERG